jgi:hypothetical protein
MKNLKHRMISFFLLAEIIPILGKNEYGPEIVFLIIDHFEGFDIRMLHIQEHIRKICYEKS